jgi:hypothetical protein
MPGEFDVRLAFQRAGFGELEFADRSFQRFFRRGNRQFNGNYSRV